MNEELTKQELEKLAKEIGKFEWGLYVNWGFKMYSGGFVTLDMYDYDDDYIYVEIISGIQCGSDDDYTRSENGKLDRKTLELL